MIAASSVWRSSAAYIWSVGAALVSQSHRSERGAHVVSSIFFVLKSFNCTSIQTYNQVKHASLQTISSPVPTSQCLSCFLSDSRPLISQIQSSCV